MIRTRSVYGVRWGRPFSLAPDHEQGIAGARLAAYRGPDQGDRTQLRLSHHSQAMEGKRNVTVNR